MVIVGGDRGDLSVRHRDLRVERSEFQMLLVLLWAIVAARKRKSVYVRIEKLDFEGSVYDWTSLPDDLIESGLLRRQVKDGISPASRRPNSLPL
ncbi:MAG: hypothetical protein WA020_16320 [Candidatus Acidiferrales bacterium]